MHDVQSQNRTRFIPELFISQNLAQLQMQGLHQTVHVQNVYQRTELCCRHVTLVTIDALTLSLATDFVWNEGATLSDPSATKRQRMWWDALTIMGALPGLSATQPEPASSMKQDDNPPSYRAIGSFMKIWVGDFVEGILLIQLLLSPHSEQ